MKRANGVRNASRKKKELVMFRIHSAWVALMAVSLLALGCGHGLLEPTPLDEHWGTSFERAKASQTLNPDASQSLEPVTGLDGQAAANDMNSYRESHAPKKADSGTGEKFILGTLGGSRGK